MDCPSHSLVTLSTTVKAKKISSSLNQYHFFLFNLTLRPRENFFSLHTPERTYSEVLVYIKPEILGINAAVAAVGFVCISTPRLLSNMIGQLVMWHARIVVRQPHCPMANVQKFFSLCLPLFFFFFLGRL